MPQVIIHTSVISDSKKKMHLINDVREAISKILEIPPNIGQVILYETSSENRCNAAGRDRNFIFIVVSMYPGRSNELKHKFADCIIDLAEKYTGVCTGDINVVIHEVSNDNYVGGISHKI